MIFVNFKFKYRNLLMNMMNVTEMRRRGGKSKNGVVIFYPEFLNDMVAREMLMKNIKVILYLKI